MISLPLALLLSLPPAAPPGLHVAVQVTSPPIPSPPAPEEGDAAGHHHDVVSTGSVTVRTGERVHDVVAIGGSVEVQGGARARDVVAVGGSVHVESGAAVERDAVAIGGAVQVDSGGRVGRDATSVGGGVHEAEGAAVGRDRVGLGLPGVASLLALASGALGIGALFSPLWLLGSLLAKLIVFLACGLLFLALWPQRLERVASELTRLPGLSVLLGCLAVAVLPVLAVLFAITVVGIPLALLEALGVAVATVVGYSALALVVGRRLPLGRAHPAIQLALGWLLLEVVFSIPILGLLVMVALWVWAFGAVVASRFGSETAAPAPPR
ncbi:MAG: hypothetical protein ACYDCL_11820 [Myxococcales bacterium]